MSIRRRPHVYAEHAVRLIDIAWQQGRETVLYRVRVAASLLPALTCVTLCSRLQGRGGGLTSPGWAFP